MMKNKRTYKARVVNYCIVTSKAGDPMVAVVFRYTDTDNAQKDITWRGSLKNEKAQEITIDTLILLGFNGTELALLANGPVSNVLDTNKDVEIVVGEEDFEGKTHTKVAYVNAVGGGGFKDKLDEAGAVQKLQGLNLAATIMERRQKSGVKASSATPKKDLPF